VKARDKAHRDYANPHRFARQHPGLRPALWRFSLSNRQITAILDLGLNLAYSLKFEV
jgi:hypothetical protein